MRLVALLSPLLVLVSLSPGVRAHGGAYQGPKDVAGGSSGAASSSASSGGAQGASGTRAPGPLPSASSSGGSRLGARGQSGRVTSGSSSGGGLGTSYLGWEFWWESNRDAYLDLKARLAYRSQVSGSPGQLTGRGPKSRHGSGVRPSVQWVESVLLPRLLAVASSADDRDVLDSTILALARSAPEGARAEVVQALTGLLAHRELSVQAAAALGLGVLRDSEAVPLLQHLLQDDSAGRQAVGGGAVPTLVRAHAALALGLIADAPAVRALLAVSVEFPDSERDIKCCSLAALGLIPRGAALAATAQQVLLERLVDEHLDDVVRSYVPTTLGKLGDEFAAAPMLAVFVARDTPNPVRQSLAIGLGQLAGPDDEAVLKALDDYVAEGRDQQTRHFALVALGQIAARPSANAGGAGDEARARVVRRLLLELRGQGASREHRSWVAMAAALLGRAQPDLVPELLTALREAHRREHDPSFRGAFALALALLNDRASAPAIAADLTEAGQDDLRGHAAEALGLLRYTQVTPVLRSLCLDPGVSETLRLKAGTGLGLLGDVDAVPLIVDALKSAKSLESLASQARAIGLIGDQAAGAALLEMAGDADAAALPRAFSLVALGLLGERDRLPFNAALKADNNYYAQVPAIAEALRIL